MFHWTSEFWNSSHPLVSVDSASPVTRVQPVAGSPGTHFGASTAVVPVLHQTAYIAITAFLINLVIAVVLTVVARLVHLPEGTDETQPAHYTADPEEAPVPVPVKTAP